MAQSNTDLFETYFKLADSDHDGRINGIEAVSFFQGSNLTRQVLAQVWTIADQNGTGFLGRQEFYNMLKLVTVAQSKRELTPDIVKAALYSPASAKIPAPQINLPTTSSQQVNVGTANVSASPPNAVTTSGPQIIGAMRPPMPPGGVSSPALLPNGSNIQVPYAPNFSVRPGTSSALSQTGLNSVAPKAVRPAAQDGLTMPPSGLPPSTQNGVQGFSHPDSSKLSDISVNSRAATLTENGHASDIPFGNVLSMSADQAKQGSTFVASSLSTSPAPTNIIQGPLGSQITVKSSPLESLHSTVTQQPMGGQHLHGHLPTQTNQQNSSKASAAFLVGAINPSGQSQASWPKITRTDVQKYNKVFMQVDTDRDGKITGEQARHLFLSWRQPQEVLKQVWDLSDQDKDSMLSLKEFCISLYLIERYREGHSLPESLPSSIMDETLFTTSSQPTAAQGYALQRIDPNIQQPQSVKGTRVVAFGGAGKPPRPLPVSQTEDIAHSSSKPKVPVLEKQILDQLSTEEQNSLNSKFQEATEAQKKVSELEMEVLDAREKIQFYHTKMQELVFHKSRCDNRLNVIMERVSADKREVESLAKKYEEKCRQAGDVASKLTLEEATFRDIQEKKMELFRAISKLSQDGSANGLQEQASHIQQDLEELVKSLNDRCKHYGLRAKPTSLVELPFGWQPGIQGPAADWDENWDKFEDEGFAIVKELSLDGPNVIAPPKPKSSIVRENEGMVDEGIVVKSSSDANVKAENDVESVAKNGVNTQNEEQPFQSFDSPRSSSGFDSVSREVENSRYKVEASFDGSPHAIQREQNGAAGSDFSKDRVFDEPNWGTFDSEYDAWDFNHTTTKESVSKHHDSSLFGSDDWGLNPIRTGPTYAENASSKQSPFFDSVPSTPIYNTGGSPLAEEDIFQRKNAFFDSVPSTPMYNTGSSPLADDMSHKKSPFSFPDSVPSTPMSNQVNSPPRSFDSFSRFDSFSMQDGGLFAPPQESSSFSRFDSMRSSTTTTGDSGLFAPPQESSSFSRFDSMRSSTTTTDDYGLFAPREDSFARFDSFRSTADSDYNFGVLPTSSNSFTRFDSMRSTTGSDYRSSFDNTDLFGHSDPFKTSSLENQSPRKNSDGWKAF